VLFFLDNAQHLRGQARFPSSKKAKGSGRMPGKTVLFPALMLLIVF
jgi:hypothetical protein